MEQYLLHMMWHYTYDKEGTWYDNEDGESTFPLVEGASYPLPNMERKRLEVLSVTETPEGVSCEVYVDHSRVIVTASPTAAYAAYDYSVCGDSVHTSLSMKLAIIREPIG